jgi:hypothetical protein
MNTIFTKYKFLFSGILLLMYLSVHAQYTETREYTRRFKIQSETRIDITNKYGKIELNTWDKDSVVIHFKMEINEKKPEKLTKTLDNLDFDISNSQHYLIIKTQIDKNRNQVENELIKFKETMLQTNGNIRIDLVVWMPGDRELKLENKFGDIIMSDYQGETSINLSNGKLKTGNLSKRSNLNLSFADANINNLNDGRIICNYSDIEIKNSGSLKFESKSSDIEIINSQSIKIESRRDKYRIRIAEKIDASGNFSQFRIYELKEMAIMKLSYGSLDFEKVLNSFSSIYIESRSAELNLNFNSDSKFGFEITEAKTDLNLNSDFKVEEKTLIDQKESKNRHTGYIGKKTTENQLRINAISGDLNLLSY